MIWKPDTCGCEIECGSLADFNSVTRFAQCDIHAGAASDAFVSVLADNRLKNAALGIAETNEAVVASWELTASGHLGLILEDYGKVSAVQSECDSALGIGKVEVSGVA